FVVRQAIEAEAPFELSELKGYALKLEGVGVTVAAGKSPKSSFADSGYPLDILSRPPDALDDSNKALMGVAVGAGTVVDTVVVIPPETAPNAIRPLAVI